MFQRVHVVQLSVILEDSTQVLMCYVVDILSSSYWFRHSVSYQCSDILVVDSPLVRQRLMSSKIGWVISCIGGTDITGYKEHM